MSRNDYPTIRHCIFELEFQRQYAQGRVDMLELINRKNPSTDAMRQSKDAIIGLLDIIETRLKEISTLAYSVYGSEIEMLTKMSLSPIEEYDAISVKTGDW